MPHYIDVVGRVALTPEQKAKAAAARQKVKEEVGPATYQSPSQFSRGAQMAVVNS